MVSYRFSALIAAMILYAALSSPTPDHPGLVEVVIGALLLVVCLPGLILTIRGAGQLKNLWQAGGIFLMVYGMSVPVLMGAAAGHSPALMLRDILPFLFLGLPLFAADLFVGDPKRFKIFLSGFVCAGTLMAARSILGSLDFFGLNFSRAQELFYFANAPSVLVAALTYVSIVVRLFMQKFDVKSLVLAGVFLLPAGIVFAAMAGSLQRASLGYAAVYILLLCGFVFYERPFRGVILAGLLGLAFAGFGAPVFEVVSALLEKTQLHGFNMRAEEFAAVRDQLSGSFAAALFGLGWGADFVSPAVGDVYVNFTHNFFSSLLLKAGIAGMVLGALYLAGLAQVLAGLCRVNFFLAAVLAGPFLIDAFLYASFKSLDFGLLLLLIPASLLSGAPPLLARKAAL